MSRSISRCQVVQIRSFQVSEKQLLEGGGQLSASKHCSQWLSARTLVKQINKYWPPSRFESDSPAGAGEDIPPPSREWMRWHRADRTSPPWSKRGGKKRFRRLDVEAADASGWDACLGRLLNRPHESKRFVLLLFFPRMNILYTVT